MPNTSVLPPPPIREPIFSGRPFEGAVMTQVWVTWFTQLFNRAGGGFSPTQNDIDILLGYSDISGAATAGAVTNLRTEVTALQEQIEDLQHEVEATQVLLAFAKDVDHV